MIVPMRHTTFLVHHSDYHSFLKELRELGVAHIHQVDPQQADEIEPILQAVRRYRVYLQELDQRKIDRLAQVTVSAIQLARQYEDLRETRYALEQAQQNTRSKLNLLGPWGEIPWKEIDALNEKGLHVGFYRCPPKVFNAAWQKEHLMGIIKRDQAEVCFALYHPDSTLPDLEGAERAYPPRFERRALLDELKNLEIRIAENDLETDTVAKNRNAFQEAIDGMSDQMHWAETIHQTDQHHDGRLMVLEAWVPREQMPLLAGQLEQLDVAWIDRSPRPGEDIPVLLKNNRFAQLFHPIVELFALPIPTEMDLTPWFAPFFTLFFGLCLGDLGYGLLLFTGATVASFIPAMAGKRSLIRLIQWLSVATALAGILTGTIFGADLGKVGPFSALSGAFLGADELFQLALWIGLVQILFGMILRAVNRSLQFGFAYGLSSIGWIFTVCGLTLTWFEYLPVIAMSSIGVGVSMILFFSDPQAGLLKRFGLGLWDLYGISGLFGDLLSYIRLFALGLSSSILGLVVNDIALSVKGDGSLIGWVFFLIILLVGHGMNFGIATLSAFVHPMRLTFVEFYKNAGFTGGGKPYSPFAKRLKPES